MAFLSIIEKILADVSKGILIFEGIEPEISAVSPASVQKGLAAATDDLTTIGKAVTDAAAVVATTNPTGGAAAVAAAAIPLVGKALAQSELLSGQEVGDVTAYATAVAGIATNVTNLLHSMKAKN